MKKLKEYLSDTSGNQGLSISLIMFAIVALPLLIWLINNIGGVKAFNITDWLFGISLSSIFFWAIFSSLVGWLFFSLVRKFNNFTPTSESLPEGFSYAENGSLLGIIERAFFVFSIAFGHLYFPLLWLGLKVGVQSNEWVGSNGRKILDAYLIINLYSIAISFLGGWFALGMPDYSQIVEHLKM